MRLVVNVRLCPILRPLGDSEHSGTYLAHLTTVLSALATIEEYSQPGFYDRLNGMAERFYEGFQNLIDESGLPVRLKFAGPRFGMHFGIDHDLVRYRDIVPRNAEMENVFIRACIERGVYFHTALHHGFSAVHTDDDLGRVLDVIEQALNEVQAGCDDNILKSTLSSKDRRVNVKLRGAMCHTMRVV